MVISILQMKNYPTKLSEEIKSDLLEFDFDKDKSNTDNIGQVKQDQNTQLF